MKIAAIDVRAWDVPMRAPYRSAQRLTTVAHNVLVRIRLADGSTGFGESAPASYVTGETQESVLQSATRAASALIGWDDAEAARTLPRLLSGQSGSFSALEMALADARAHAAGQPLLRLLGADDDCSTEAVTDLSLPLLPPDEAAERAARAAQSGFRALKIKVGCGDAGADRERVEAVAAAAPDATLRLDGNQGFSAEAAVRFIESLDAALTPRIELYEQPTKAGDDAALHHVQRGVPFPVFADEAVKTADDARRLIAEGACRGVVLKIAKSGLSGATAVARAAHGAGGKCLFGCMMETRIGIAAALHLALALGTEIVPMLDLDGDLLVDDAEAVTGDGLIRTADRMRIDPDALGLGVAAVL